MRAERTARITAGQGPYGFRHVLKSTIVSGSIPPNKSDLKVFGAYTEQGSSGKFLELFWSRVQNPSGTTNMDFELNQMFCQPAATPSNCANNGVAVPETPVRTPGDLLITYDLSKGGTVPSIGLRTWGCAGTSRVQGPPHLRRPFSLFAPAIEETEPE